MNYQTILGYLDMLIPAMNMKCLETANKSALRMRDHFSFLNKIDMVSRISLLVLSIEQIKHVPQTWQTAVTPQNNPLPLATRNLNLNLSKTGFYVDVAI